jgi:hypothetical protein
MKTNAKATIILRITGPGVVNQNDDFRDCEERGNEPIQRPSFRDGALAPGPGISSFPDVQLHI